MMRRGVITPACSERVAHLRFIEMKSLNGAPKYKFCTDFRRLNAVKKISAYSIPDMGNLSLIQVAVTSPYWT
jgi:hypothetical protein